MPILLLQVQRVAAIKSHHFHEIKPILETYIAMKRNVKNDERTTRKLQHWPFNKGEQVQLIWNSSPFWYDNKIMINVYFKVERMKENSEGKEVKLGKILADWGTLPALAIQHYYIDGDITKSIPPEGIGEIDITIYSNNVSTYERDWKVQGTNDKGISEALL
ncbi:hypothetical protein V7212_01340 [Bacillus safensis]|uniref:hypothetical protein n=1 Tax=Bacillus safensis TaxID=561879 RepID=UPI002FFF04C9